MSNPRINVIIPTRERGDVLVHALRTVTAQDYDNLEIIVSDNHSQDDTKDVVRRANDRRIRYLNTGNRLGMSENWEFALSHVRDGWVTFMGDDDGLLPGATAEVANLIRSTNLRAIRSNFCTYDWPGVPEHERGQLIVPLTSGTETRCCQRWLRKILTGNVSYKQLPMIYNGGFIHLSVLKDIKEATGNFFGSAIPDVYTAVAVARVIKEYLYVRSPLAISGTSRHSNGHSSMSISKKRNTEALHQYSVENGMPYHADIPMMPDGTFPRSLQACVYEAYLQSEILGNSVNNVDHATQLRAILATSGKHRAAITEWACSFAKQHHIDNHKFRDKGALRYHYAQARTLLDKTARALNSVIVDNLPIRNIHEASVAAATIRSGPGRADSFRFLANEVSRRLRSRSSGTR